MAVKPEFYVEFAYKSSMNYQRSGDANKRYAPDLNTCIARCEVSINGNKKYRIYTADKAELLWTTEGGRVVGTSWTWKIEVRSKNNPTWRKPNVMQELWNSGMLASAQVAIRESAKRDANIREEVQYRIMDNCGNVSYTYDSLTCKAISNYDNDKETPEMEYEARKPLHIKRETLIEKVQATIDEAKAKHNEAEAKALTRSQDLIDRVVFLAENAPGAVAMALKSHLGVYDEGALSEKLGHEAAAAVLREQYPAPGTEKFKPDPAAQKLVNVLEAATDEQIEVTPSDDFYAYL